ncbi:MAG: DoxX family protein [Bacteroidales bacterium]|jgi:uncharacterized membrane protein YphA (DoxX/SURF4 family)|nr:DoxX family protein [Bacteroidales bacterium]
MKILRNFSRILIGIVFIFSGFVKVVDPIGYSYKFIEYFEAMGLNFMSGGAVIFAILMAGAELLLGIALFFNLVPKFSAWVLLLFMLMFTPLTLWLAIANPVSDCGCFGDALVITNWQTFFKNVIIDVFTAIIFIQRNKFKPLYTPFFQWTLAVIFIIGVYGLEIYCLNNIPILDFRPYHIGASIKDGMIIPEDQKDNKSVFENILIYEKNGIKNEFVLDKNTISELNDKSIQYNFSEFTKEWKFVERKDKLIKQGYEPPIHDFTITPIYIQGFSPEPPDDVFLDFNNYKFIYSNAEGLTKLVSIKELPDNSWTFQTIAKDNNNQDIDVKKVNITYLAPDSTTQIFNLVNLAPTGYTFLRVNDYLIPSSDFKTKYDEDITEYVLNNNNFSFLAIMKKVDESNEKYIENLNTIATFCNEKGYDFYCLTSSVNEDIEKFIEKHHPNFNFYSTDETTLKTIIRSNPGLLLLRNGIILDKWADKNIPEISELQNDLQAYSITEQQDKNDFKLVICYILGILLFMSFFHISYSWLQKKKFINNL